MCIRDRNKFNKVITLYIVSSSINPKDVNRAKSTISVEDYLIKPVSVNYLENIFKKAI